MSNKLLENHVIVEATIVHEGSKIDINAFRQAIKALVGGVVSMALEPGGSVTENLAKLVAVTASETMNNGAVRVDYLAHTFVECSIPISKAVEGTWETNFLTFSLISIRTNLATPATTLISFKTMTSDDV